MTHLMKRFRAAWRAFQAPDLPSLRWPVSAMQPDAVLRVEDGQYWVEDPDGNPYASSRLCPEQ